MKSSVRCVVITKRNLGVKIKGELRRVFPDGSLSEPLLNTIATDFKQDSCGGAATGSMDAVDTAEITVAGPVSYICATSLYAGGTGAEDYVTFEFSWQNVTGGTKTVNSIDMGYDVGGGSEVVYFQKSGLSHAVQDEETITYQWKITFAYTSGGVTNDYRYNIAKMTTTGTFLIPTKIDFNEAGPSLLATENAVLNAGGDGATDYHEWTATYTSSGSNTVDTIKLYSDDPSGFDMADEDIVDKVLADTEELVAYIKIQHS